jgi:hypothetical protein
MAPDLSDQSSFLPSEPYRTRHAMMMVGDIEAVQNMWMSKGDTQSLVHFAVVPREGSWKNTAGKNSGS